VWLHSKCPILVVFVNIYISQAAAKVFYVAAAAS